MDFNNMSGLKFVDISSESYRKYVFPEGEIRIDGPLKLNVSSAGGHRVWDGATSHYIPKGWIHLSWQAKPGQPHFVK